MNENVGLTVIYKLVCSKTMTKSKTSYSLSLLPVWIDDESLCTSASRPYIIHWCWICG